MSQPPFEWPQSYLDQVRRVFEPRYGEKLSDEKVLKIANNLYDYAVICYDSWKKRQKKEENRIRTPKSAITKPSLGIVQSRDKSEKQTKVRVEPNKPVS